MFEPARTVTVAGTIALGLSLDKLTTVSVAFAFCLTVTVPVEVEPPITVVGVMDKVFSRL